MDEEILTLTREQLTELKKRFLHSSMLQEKSYVRISDDKMEAWLYLAEPSEEEEKYKIDSLLDMLRQEGVEEGYLMPRLVAMAKKGDLLFVDEIHRLNRQVEEVLYPAMEDYAIDIMIGKGAAARSIRLDLPKFTLVGATTRAGLLTAPLRDRFGVIHRLEFYSVEELCQIILHSAKVLEVEIEKNGAMELARRSRGTPRIANRILKRVRDFAQVRYDGIITEAVADTALDLLDVDKLGLDYVDRNILLTIIEKFCGGPVGLDTLAASIGEDAGTIEDVYEPYLIQNGLLNRTPRGRMATELAYRHLGLEIPT